MGPRHYALDFAASTPPLRWPLALAIAAGLVALALGLGEAHAGWSALQAERARSDLLPSAAPAPATMVRRSAKAPASGTDSRLDAELQRVAQTLHRPWPQVLAGLEARAAEGIRLVQASVDPGFGQLTLVVQAREMAAVVAYLRSFDAGAPPLGRARLLAHEWSAAGDAAAAGPRILTARLAVALSADLAVPASADRLPRRAPASVIAVRPEAACAAAGGRMAVGPGCPPERGQP